MDTTRSQKAVNSAPKTEKSPYGHYTGKVIAVNQGNTTVDIRMFSGDTLRGVRVLFNSANTIAGWRYLASIKNTDPQPGSRGTQDTALLSNEQDTIAVVVYLNGDFRAPRVIGFDYPLNSQMHVNEQGLLTVRHESGVYEIIDKNGHHETHYPDGSYVIFANDSSPKNMSGIQGNGQAWSTPTGPTNKMTVHLSEGIDIKSDGSGNLTVTTKGKISLNGTLF